MDFTMEGYEDLELSTQMMIKEAFKRGLEVEVLDRKENFISLSDGSKTEYIGDQDLIRQLYHFSYYGE